jgi:hypothetical protein
VLLDKGFCHHLKSTVWMCKFVALRAWRFPC